MTIVAVIPAIAIAGVVAVTKVGVNPDGRSRKRTRIRKAKAEFQPPEAPEGRYWG